MSETTTAPRPALWRLAAFTLGVLLLIYTVAGFVWLPVIARLVLPSTLSNSIHGEFHTGALWLNPYTFSLTVHHFQLTDSDGNTIAQGERLHGNIDPIRSLLSGEITIAEASLQGLELNLVRLRDGEMNLLQAVAPVNPQPRPEPTGPSEPLALPLVHIRLLELGGATIHFRDETRSPEAFTTTLSPINFRIDDFRTASEAQNHFTFNLTSTRQELLHVEGDLRFDPLSTSGQINLRHLDLASLKPYLDDFVNLSQLSGHLSMGTHFTFAPLAETPAVSLDNAYTYLRNIRLQAEGAEQPFLELDNYALEGLHIDLLARQAHLSGITIANPTARAGRNAQGQLMPLASLLPETTQAPATTTSTTPEAPAEPLRLGLTSDGRDLGEPIAAVLEFLPEALDLPAWEASLGHLTLQNAALELTDNALPRPLRLTLAETDFNLQHLTTIGEPAQLEIKTTINQSGRASLKGQVTPWPAAAHLTYDLSELNLSTFSPLLESLVAAELKSGQLSTNGELQANLDPSGPQAVLTTNVSINQYALHASGENEPLVAYDAFELRNARISYGERLDVRIEDILLRQPHAKAERLADGQLAVMQLLPSSPASAPTEPAPSATPMPRPHLEIGRIAVEDGSVEVVDAAVSPPLQLDLTEINSETHNLSLMPGREATIALRARIAAQGTANIEGRLQPLDPGAQSQLSLFIKDLPLTKFSPYASEFIGRPIRQGSFSADVQVSVTDQALDGEPVLRIQQMRLGDARPDAPVIEIPIQQGLMMLEDGNGIATLRIPLRGNLDNPQFDILSIFTDAVTASLTSVATAPFNMLASVIGGDPEQIDHCTFQPGSAEMDAAGRQSLAQLAEALRKRPNINLRLTPSLDPVHDLALLRAERLQQLRQAAREALGPDATEEALVRHIHELAFHQRPPQPEPETAPAAAPEPPEPSPTEEAEPVAAQSAPAPEVPTSTEPPAAQKPEDRNIPQERYYTTAHTQNVRFSYYGQGPRRSVKSRHYMPEDSAIENGETPSDESMAEPEPMAETEPEVPDPSIAKTTATEPAAAEAPQPSPAQPALNEAPLALATLQRELRENLPVPQQAARLAQQRSEAVLAILTSELGLDPARFSKPPDSSRPPRDGAAVFFSFQSTQ